MFLFSSLVSVCVQFFYLEFWSILDFIANIEVVQDFFENHSRSCFFFSKSLLNVCCDAKMLPHFGHHLQTSTPTIYLLIDHHPTTWSSFLNVSLKTRLKYKASPALPAYHHQINVILLKQQQKRVYKVDYYSITKKDIVSYFLRVLIALCELWRFVSGIRLLSRKY